MAKEIANIFIMNVFCIEHLSDLTQTSECEHDFHDNYPFCRNVNYELTIIDLHTLFIIFYFFYLVDSNKN